MKTPHTTASGEDPNTSACADSGKFVTIQLWSVQIARHHAEDPQCSPISRAVSITVANGSA
jgi:hypothetical protein